MVLPLPGGLLASVLASAAAGAGAGTIGGALLGMGLTEDDVDYYYDEVSAGRILVTVRAGNRYEEAMTILRRNGGMFSLTEDTADTSDTLSFPNIAGT